MRLKLAVSKENLVHAVALLTATMGVTNVLSAVTPAIADRAHLSRAYLPFRVETGGHLTSAFAGFALLLLSINLWFIPRHPICL